MIRFLCWIANPIYWSITCDKKQWNIISKLKNFIFECKYQLFDDWKKLKNWSRKCNERGFESRGSDNFLQKHLCEERGWAAGEMCGIDWGVKEQMISAQTYRCPQESLLWQAKHWKVNTRGMEPAHFNCYNSFTFASRINGLSGTFILKLQQQ